MTTSPTITPYDQYAQLAGRRIPRLGMGCMALSIEGRPERATAIDTIHAALDAGVRYLDTAWSYYLPSQPGTGRPGDLGYGERLVHDAVRTWHGPRDEVLIATKTGWLRTLNDHGTYGWRADARPETIVTQIKESARRLDVESFDLLYSHCDDPAVPYEDQMGAFRQLVDEGVARYIGVSRVVNSEIDCAQAVLGDALVAVQNQFSPSYRDPQGTLEHCASRGIAFVCFSPLGGFLDPVDDSAYDQFREVARRHGVSHQQVTLAWELRQYGRLFTIPSARTPQEILDSFAAMRLELSDADMKLLDAWSVHDHGTIVP